MNKKDTDFLKSLFKLLNEHGETCNNFGTYPTIKHKPDCKLTITKFNKLIKVIKDNSLVILPYSVMGFHPAYRIYNLEGNPLIGWSCSDVLVDIDEKQLPKEINHEKMKEYFLSARNMELAEIVNQEINPNRDYYY